MKLIVGLSVCWFLVGCSTFTKVAKQSQELTKIKRVAVVGFSLVYQEPDSVFQRLAKMKAGFSASTGKINGGPNADVTALYKQFVGKLQQENGWEVLSANEIDRSASYRKLVTDYTTGLVLRPPLPENFTAFRSDLILDGEAFSLMKSPQKSQLVKDLGVDAVVIVRLVSSIEEEGGLKKYIGMSEFRPRAQAIVEVLDGNSEKAIWTDSWAWGTGDKAVQSTLRIVDNRELMDQVKIAVNHAYNDLFGRYKNE